MNGPVYRDAYNMTDPAQSPQDVDNIRSAIKSAKDPGNLHSLFMYSPNGKTHGIQIIPLSEVATKDKFLDIKNLSRDDMLAVHSVPPELMGKFRIILGDLGILRKLVTFYSKRANSSTKKI